MDKEIHQALSKNMEEERHVMAKTNDDMKRDMEKSEMRSLDMAEELEQQRVLMAMEGDRKDANGAACRVQETSRKEGNNADNLQGSLWPEIDFDSESDSGSEESSFGDEEIDMILETLDEMGKSKKEDVGFKKITEEENEKVATEFNIKDNPQILLKDLEERQHCEETVMFTTANIKPMEGEEKESKDNKEQMARCMEKEKLQSIIKHLEDKQQEEEIRKEELQKAAMAFVRRRTEDLNEDSESETDSDEDYFDEEEKQMIIEAERKLKEEKEREERQQEEWKISEKNTKQRMLDMAQDMEEQKVFMRKAANRVMWGEQERARKDNNDEKRQGLLWPEIDFDSESDSDSDESSFGDEDTDMILETLDNMDKRKEEKEREERELEERRINMEKSEMRTLDMAEELEEQKVLMELEGERKDANRAACRGQETLRKEGNDNLQRLLWPEKDFDSESDSGSEESSFGDEEIDMILETLDEMGKSKKEDVGFKKITEEENEKVATEYNIKENPQLLLKDLEERQHCEETVMFTTANIKTKEREENERKDNEEQMARRMEKEKLQSIVKHLEDKQQEEEIRKEELQKAAMAFVRRRTEDLNEDSESETDSDEDYFDEEEKQMMIIEAERKLKEEKEREERELEERRINMEKSEMRTLDMSEELEEQKVLMELEGERKDANRAACRVQETSRKTGNNADNLQGLLWPEKDFDSESDSGSEESSFGDEETGMILETLDEMGKSKKEYVGFKKITEEENEKVATEVNIKENPQLLLKDLERQHCKETVMFTTANIKTMEREEKEGKDKEIKEKHQALFKNIEPAKEMRQEVFEKENKEQMARCMEKEKLHAIIKHLEDKQQEEEIRKEELQKAAMAFVRRRTEELNEDTESDSDSDEDYFDEEEKQMVMEAERKLKAEKEREGGELEERKISDEKAKKVMLGIIEGEKKEEEEKTVMHPGKNGEGESKTVDKEKHQDLCKNMEPAKEMRQEVFETENKEQMARCMEKEKLHAIIKHLEDKQQEEEIRKEEIQKAAMAFVRRRTEDLNEDTESDSDEDYFDEEEKQMVKKLNAEKEREERELEEWEIIVEETKRMLGIVEGEKKGEEKTVVHREGERKTVDKEKHQALFKNMENEVEIRKAVEKKQMQKAAMEMQTEERELEARACMEKENLHSIIKHLEDKQQEEEIRKEELQKAAMAFVRRRTEDLNEDTDSETDSDEDYFDEEEKQMVMEAERKFKEEKEREERELDEWKISEKNSKQRMLDMAQDMKEQKVFMEGERKAANRAM
ncbi:trichohyalin-like [Engraulis encrasicolus]|uniref:trichohyalin-like n=1 Tax=Engraulis encrasicolus TaxID=184585 RepID=UPI002FD6490D